MALPQSHEQLNRTSFSDVGGVPARRVDLVSASTIYAVTSTTNQSGTTVFQGSTPWNSLGTTVIANSMVTVTMGTALSSTVDSVAIGSNVTLNPSPNFIGLVSAASIHGKVELVASTANIGFATIFIGAGEVAVTELPGAQALSDSIGNPATTSIGSHLMAWNTTDWYRARGDTTNGLDVDVTRIGAGSSFIGLVSTASVHARAELVASSAYVGLATVIPAVTVPTSLYTSLATVISASGNATIFVPPSGQRWVAKDIMIGVQGSVLVSILSGTVTKLPAMSLATQSGYVQNFGPEGLRAVAVDQSFVVNLGSAATVAVMANVRFE